MSDRHAERVRRTLAEPVKDGQRHPGELELANASFDLGASTDQWCLALLESARSNVDRASLLRLLGRVGLPVREEVRSSLLTSGLVSPSVEVRAAAVQAVESWADASLLPVLRGHRDPATWLEEYKNQVVDDLLRSARA